MLTKRTSNTLNNHKAEVDCCWQSTNKLTTASPNIVNDVHSQLNRTVVRDVVRPSSLSELGMVVRRAQQQASGCALSLAGGRHAMGGQQFGRDTILVDMTSMKRVLSFDPAACHVTVEAGILWPELISFLIFAQRDEAHQVGIIQKQTGADRLSIGGALSANIHGRGLRLKPIIEDVESFVLVDAQGEAQTCSRTENCELFRLAIGGYGLFGIIYSVTLRLAPRQKLRRFVRIVDLPEVLEVFDQRITQHALYGDFQFMTDGSADEFLRRGILSCYEAMDDSEAAHNLNDITPVEEQHRELSADNWRELIYLAHTNRKLAWELYSQHYLSTCGQFYWSDTHQLSVYIDNYHEQLDRRLNATCQSSEMITELYVPRNRFVDFMEAARRDFRQHAVELIYGTVRLIERDEESFLAWARESYVCVIFNLHVEHTRTGIRKAQADFQRLIDRAIEQRGSYYLTYHAWATQAQVESCYPQFKEFLSLKRKYDSAEIFVSDWYQHHRQMFD